MADGFALMTVKRWAVALETSARRADSVIIMVIDREEKVAKLQPFAMALGFVLSVWLWSKDSSLGRSSACHPSPGKRSALDSEALRPMRTRFLMRDDTLGPAKCFYPSTVPWYQYYTAVRARFEFGFHIPTISLTQVSMSARKLTSMVWQSWLPLGTRRDVVNRTRMHFM